MQGNIDNSRSTEYIVPIPRCHALHVTISAIKVQHKMNLVTKQDLQKKIQEPD